MRESKELRELMVKSNTNEYNQNSMLKLINQNSDKIIESNARVDIINQKVNVIDKRLVQEQALLITAQNTIMGNYFQQIAEKFNIIEKIECQDLTKTMNEIRKTSSETAESDDPNDI